MYCYAIATKKADENENKNKTTKIKLKYRQLILRPGMIQSLPKPYFGHAVNHPWPKYHNLGLAMRVRIFQIFQTKKTV
jgi:hypothetical protein